MKVTVTVIVIIIVILISGSSREGQALRRSAQDPSELGTTLLQDEGGEEAGDRDPAGALHT